jgi:16S rRNA (cytidine1402-2'-O)-methyltransferase
VTDAGTPLVSDPGEGLVGAWAARGGTVVPIPGPSAVLAALVASGIPAPRWAFEGFLPRKGGERRERLARIASDDRATVLFEAPGRTAATVRDLAAACGVERAAAICRELTKRHEEVRRGTLGALAAALADAEVRGEVTIVVAGAPAGGAGGRATTGAVGLAGAGTLPASPADALAGGRARVAALVAQGTARAAAARQVARETGLSRRALYGGGEEDA